MEGSLARFKKLAVPAAGFITDAALLETSYVDLMNRRFGFMETNQEKLIKTLKPVSRELRISENEMIKNYSAILQFAPRIADTYGKLGEETLEFSKLNTKMAKVFKLDVGTVADSLGHLFNTFALGPDKAKETVNKLASIAQNTQQDITQLIGTVSKLGANKLLKGRGLSLNQLIDTTGAHAALDEFQTGAGDQFLNMWSSLSTEPGFKKEFARILGYLDTDITKVKDTWTFWTLFPL